MEVTREPKDLQVKSSFSALPIEQKLQLLCLLAHEITLRARGAYPGQVQEQEAAKKLVTFNELQHSISGQLRKMLTRNEKRYPDQTFIDILFEEAGIGSCEGDLQIAFEMAFEHLQSQG